MNTSDRLQQRLPHLYREIREAVGALGREDVAAQLAALTIERYTLDRRELAMYLYTGGMRELTAEELEEGIRHGECLDLTGNSGMVVMDLDNFGRVRGIEVIDRPDVEVCLL